MKPYYEGGGVVLFLGDARDVMPRIHADVMVTDPPFGIGYESGYEGVLARSIAGDESVRVRDDVLAAWPGPALVFGSWRAPRPAGTRMVLVWDTLGALGMGDLTLPWKPAHQEIYVIGSGFVGHRGSDVLSYPPVQASAWRGRKHPHEKPIPLMRALLSKCPPGVVIDPFCGSGSTLRAAKDLGRSAIGIEIDEQYAELAANRLAQEVLAL